MKAFLFLLIGAMHCSTLWAGYEYFSTGMLKDFRGEEKFSLARGQEKIAEEFLRQAFSELRGDLHWVKIDSTVDKTHAHFTYRWQYGDRPVLDHLVKVHVNHSGVVDLANNSLQSPFLLPVDPGKTQKQVEFWQSKIHSDWKSKLGDFQGRIQVDPVVWVEPKTHRAVEALDVRVIIDHPWTLKHYIIQEDTGAILEEKQVARSATATVKVFNKSPYASTAPVSVTLSDLTNTSSLRNTFLWVRREKISGSSTSTLDVEPQDFTSATGYVNSPTPTQYNYTCSGTNTDCGNMSFDAVNVYYHLSNYRTRISQYLAQLGAQVSFPYDAPVNANTGATNTFSVLINPVSLDFGSPGLSDDANNALYVGEPCRSDGSMDRCLVFLRPAALTSSDASTNCGTSSATLYDLAREAVVVAHEYQHYVTDTITHIAFSASSSPKVGDALHEAYSDYLAASYVSDINGADVTLVGQYALSECPPLQRQLNALRVYDDNDKSNADPHTSGITWASAFWKLRTEYGMTVADLLAIKSLFFLSPNPGFFEAIEAVVKADETLYGGAHVDRIRRLFYGEAKFTGKAVVSADGVAEVGFKGCAAVHGAAPPTLLGLLVVGAWLGFTLVLGRRRI